MIKRIVTTIVVIILVTLSFSCRNYQDKVAVDNMVAIMHQQLVVFETQYNAIKSLKGKTAEMDAQIAALEQAIRVLKYNLHIESGNDSV